MQNAYFNIVDVKAQKTLEQLRNRVEGTAIEKIADDLTDKFFSARDRMNLSDMRKILNESQRYLTTLNRK